MAQTVLPYSRAVAITPHDSNVQHVTGFYVGDTSGGDVVVVKFEEDPDTSITLTGLVEGVVYPFEIRVFLSTGTTAASIVGFP